MDYLISISLVYYGFMACFSGFVHTLPSLSFGDFIKCVINGFINISEGNKITINEEFPHLDDSKKENTLFMSSNILNLFIFKFLRVLLFEK